MLHLSSQELREHRQKFRENNKHKYLPEASLIADKESTALFNVAGMQQLIPFLVGKEHTLGKRLYNIQKCVRTNDIDDIGDERHLSLFEMMGNRSLGDYFKQESITWTIQFLHDELQIPLDKIGATVFAGDEKQGIPRDEESIAVLGKLGITHIKEMWFDDKGESDNFWTPGPIGPCGPCAEFYYDRGEAYGPTDRDMGVNDRYTEIWNNVFMCYYSDGSGKLTELPQKNVDTGMGFERLLLVLQEKETVFDTDLFKPLIDRISEFTWVYYNWDNIKSLRIFADHFRTSVLLIDSWLTPSNEWRWYILRRLIRRFYYRFADYKINNSGLLTDLLIIVSKWLNKEFNDNLIVSTLIKEMDLFSKTLESGRKQGTKLIEYAKENKWTNIWLEIFKLYDTYWYPYELSIELLENWSKSIQKDIIKKVFESELTKQQDRSRAATKGKFSLDVDRSAHIQWLPSTKFIGYGELESTDSKLLKDFEVNGQRVLVFDTTPFYAEWGWQTGDRGVITLDGGEQVKVIDVKKYEGIYLHLVA